MRHGRAGPYQTGFDEVQALLVPDIRSGTIGSGAVKVKGVITRVPEAGALQAEVRLYDRLFKEAHPEAGGVAFLHNLNANSLSVIQTEADLSLSGMSTL